MLSGLLVPRRRIDLFLLVSEPQKMQFVLENERGFESLICRVIIVDTSDVVG